jgi:hypothetical protein
LQTRPTIVAKLDAKVIGSMFHFSFLGPLIFSCGFASSITLPAATVHRASPSDLSITSQTSSRKPM